MADDHIRYDILTQDALRGVVRKVLSEVAKTGLPGDHHFFISFSTRAPGVRMSERLLEQYETEMTIVLQNQFWDLKTSETGFEVTLSFEGVSETLFIPYAALKGFFDPSVQFAMSFDSALPAESAAPPVEAVAEKAQEPDTEGEETAEEAGGSDAEKVISLDSFRKKP